MTSGIKSISPSRVGRYYHLECPRYLRYSSTARADRAAEGVPGAPHDTRPVHQAVLDAGLAWEDAALDGPLAGVAIVPDADPERHATPRHDRRHGVEASLGLIASAPVGKAIYQATLRPPARFYDRYRLDPARVALTDCHPDLIEVREGPDGGRLLRVTDLKVSRGVRLSHRIQAALYTLLLRDILLDLGAQGTDPGARGTDLGTDGIDPRGDARPGPAQADLEPAIWLVGEDAPTPFDIRAILPPLEQFLEHELTPLLAAPATEAPWAFGTRCETCDYFLHCRDEMRATDDVTRVPGITGHAKAFLRTLQPRVATVEELAGLVATQEGRDALEDVGSLRGRTDRLARQVRALRDQAPVDHGGSSLALPIGEHVRLVFTVQTEPVTGHVYGWAVTAQGLKGLVEPNPFTQAMVAGTNDADEIGRVERELVRAIHRILLAVHEHNEAQGGDWKAQKSLQAYAYDTYEDALLTGVLVRALSDPEVAEEALAVFFHFQRPELMEASEHPGAEAAIPVVVLSQVIRSLVALPLEVTYRLPDVATLLPREGGGFAYQEHPYFDYELSNQLRPDAIFSLWHEGRLDRMEWIGRKLRARVWAASSLVDGLRQHLDANAPGTLFAWPPKFRLPARMGFRQPVLSRLAFVVQYESTLAYLAVRSARMGPLEERLRSEVTIELEREEDGAFRIVSGGPDPRIDEDGFPKWILTPATPEGERAALAFPDWPYRDRTWAPKDRAVALAGIESVVRDELGRATHLRLEVTLSSGFGRLVPGARYRLDARYTDFLSKHALDELREVDAETDPAYVRMLERPAEASVVLDVPPEVRASALDLGQRHGMTASQLGAFRQAVERSIALTWGPPGTGKTHFLAVAILCLAEAHRRAGLPFSVVVTAFTHAAIDNCLRKVVEVQRLRGIVEGGIAIGKVGRVERNGAGIEAVDKQQGDLFLASGRLAVLGGTVWGLRKGVSAGRADMVVIDEGSQLKVPEAAIAVRRLRAGGRLVVAGDHLQLPPIVTGMYPDPEEDEPYLHRSIFEALRGRDGQSGIVSSLLENFRMNGTLCRYPADQIYDPRYDSATDEVRARRLRLADAPVGNPVGADGPAGSEGTAAPEALADLLIDPDFPLVVVVLDGIRAAAENQVEAGLVADVAVRLRERLCASDGRPYRDDAAFWADGLFVVSPHHAQIDAIRRALRARRAWSSAPFVDTVDKMQGQECDAVVVSYGVADVEYAMGEREFIYSLNRLNVSITRGRAKTVVFLSRALTEPPVQALADDRNAAGIAFMQGLVRFAETHGEGRVVPLEGEATARVVRTAASS